MLCSSCWFKAGRTFGTLLDHWLTIWLHVHLWAYEGPSTLFLFRIWFWRHHHRWRLKYAPTVQVWLLLSFSVPTVVCNPVLVSLCEPCSQLVKIFSNLGAVWNKGDGVASLIDSLHDSLKDGKVLVAGDTSSDLPMLQYAVSENPNVGTSEVFF